MSEWVDKVSTAIQEFSDNYSAVYSKTERELSASFEIGCFLALIHFYQEKNFDISLEGLVNNQFKYLTTPSGNPNNFSFIKLKKDHTEFEIRQQVRIKSHVDPEICFTPDIVVLKFDSQIRGLKREDYASSL